mgnify:CR=1 FL=1
MTIRLSCYLFLMLVVLMSLAGTTFTKNAYASEDDGVLTSPPPSLEFLQNIEQDDELFIDDEIETDFDIRTEALEEAAISLGARGGLAYRTFYIRKMLDQRSSQLNKVFDFRQLLIPAPSGLLIEPPIISEAMDNMLINSDGKQAAVADRVFNIGVNARIVSAPRTWQQYLEREFNEVDPPPQILRPKTEEERRKWKNWVAEGWKNGIEQADEIFEADLARLNADYEGMIRYRKLLAQGMVSEPFALQNDRGITGGGDLLRIGDRSVRLTGMPQLKPGYQEWQPASR